jgi:arylsulfatase A-like enzyme
MLARRADVYAGYMAYTDHEIERVIQTFEDVGKRDNGASPEGTAARLARQGMGWGEGGSKGPDYSPDGLQR